MVYEYGVEFVLFQIISEANGSSTADDNVVPTCSHGDGSHSDEKQRVNIFNNK